MTSMKCLQGVSSAVNSSVLQRMDALAFRGNNFFYYFWESIENSDFSKRNDHVCLYGILISKYLKCSNNVFIKTNTLK